MNRDYITQAWFDGKLVDETLITDCSEEVLHYHLETMRADYPGCETRVYTCTVDVQGGTVDVFNLKRV